jgi:hypothetical protein
VLVVRESGSEADLSLFFKEISRALDALRRRIGTSGPGKLSTLLKTASNEPERQRYLRLRQMLETFTTRNKVE